jgi:hypothetical protein
MVRDNTGKFVKGHEGTGGRKPRATEEKYLQLLKKTVSPDDWKEIIQRAVTDAKRGDGIARKFIADYLIGAPVQRLEHAGEDGGAIRIEYINAAYPVTSLSPRPVGDSPEPQEV